MNFPKILYVLVYVDVSVNFSKLGQDIFSFGSIIASIRAYQ